MKVISCNNSNVSRGWFVAVAWSLLLSGCATLEPGYGGADFLGQQEAQVNRSDLSQDVLADDSLNLMVAEIALNRGDTDTAIEYYRRVAVSQNSAEIAERAVRVAVYGQNLEVAVELARRWIELDPARLEARQAIAAIYIRQNRIEDAFGYVDGLIEASDLAEAQLYSSMLDTLAREKNSEAVLAVSRRVADKHTVSAHAQYLHAMLAAQNNQVEEALDYFDRSLVLGEIVGVHAARARILLRLGRSDEAVHSLDKAVAANPDDQNLRLTYARLLVDVKEYEKARAEFEKLLQAAPNDAELLYTLGLLSLESQRLDDAEKYMMMLIRLDERDGEARIV